MLADRRDVEIEIEGETYSGHYRFKKERGAGKVEVSFMYGSDSTHCNNLEEAERLARLILGELVRKAKKDGFIKD